MRLFFYLLSPFSLRLGYVFCDLITPIIIALNVEIVKISRININIAYPSKDKEDKDSRGFYKCITKTDKQLKVRDTKDLEKIKEQNNWGFNKGDNNNPFIWYPCYRDINDIETLEYWLVYYKK